MRAWCEKRAYWTTSPWADHRLKRTGATLLMVLRGAAARGCWPTGQFMGHAIILVAREWGNGASEIRSTYVLNLWECNLSMILCGYA